jgi:hypothetical protein
VTDFLQHFLVLFEFLHLLLSVLLFVARIAFERERVERVLGVFLMVDVAMSILPVGELLLVH